MNENKQYMNLMVEDCVLSNHTLFFLVRNMNLVGKKNLETGETEIYPGIPEGSMFSDQKASQIVIWEGKLFFIPKKAKAIWISDWEMNNWEKVEYEEVPKGCYAEYVALQAFLDEDRLFIIGSDYPAIMCLSSDRRITYIREPYERFLPEMNKMRELFFRKDYVKIENCIYLASCRDNFILKFWLDTFNYEWIEVGAKGNTYSGVAMREGKFWMAPRRYGTSIVKWDGKENVEEIILPKNIKNVKHPFLGIVNRKDGLFLPGNNQPTSILISSHGEIKTIEEQYFFYKRIEGGEYIAQNTNGKTYYISHNGDLHDNFCIADRKDFLRFYQLYLSQLDLIDFYAMLQNIRTEDCAVQLIDMVKMLIKFDEYHFGLKGRYCGKKIWTFLKDEEK